MDAVGKQENKQDLAKKIISLTTAGYSKNMIAKSLNISLIKLNKITEEIYKSLPRKEERLKNIEMSLDWHKRYAFNQLLKAENEEKKSYQISWFDRSRQLLELEMNAYKNNIYVENLFQQNNLLTIDNLLIAIKNGEEKKKEILREIKY